jgi:hypothetical protein
VMKRVSRNGCRALHSMTMIPAHDAAPQRLGLKKNASVKPSFRPRVIRRTSSNWTFERR